jgi:hypothetical protein
LFGRGVNFVVKNSAAVAAKKSLPDISRLQTPGGAVIGCARGAQMPLRAGRSEG